jgi:hypothetical protein
MPLEPAYLPQYVAETMGAVVGAVAIITGVVLIVKGAVPGFDQLRVRTVRLAGLGQLVFGAAVVFVSFAIDAEARCDGCGRDHWGGTAGIIMLSVWVLIALGFVGAEARRWRTHRRS